MINKRQKMRVNNMKVRKWLVENNFKDIHFFPHTRFIKDLHFQDLDFDGLASIGTTLVLFQCKSNNKPTKKMQQQYAKVSKKFNILCMWFNAVDRKGLDIYPKNNKVAKSQRKTPLKTISHSEGEPK